MTFTRFFQGQTPNHAAFILNPAEMRSLSTTKGAAQFIFPWVRRHELFSSVCLNRSVVDISGVRFEEQLRTSAPGLADWLEERVKPTRLEAAKRRSSDPTAKEREIRRYKILVDRWWQLHHRRAEMVTRLDPLPRFLVIPRYRRASAGQRHFAAFVCGGARPGDDLLAIPSADIETFGVISSRWLPDLLQRARDQAEVNSRTVPSSTSRTLSLDLPIEEHGAIGTIATEILNVRREARRRLDLPLGRLYEWEGLLPLVPELHRLHEHLDSVVHKALVRWEARNGPSNFDLDGDVDCAEDAATYVDLCRCECTAHT